MVMEMFVVSLAPPVVVAECPRHSLPWDVAYLLPLQKRPWQAAADTKLHRLTNACGAHNRRNM